MAVKTVQNGNPKKTVFRSYWFPIWKQIIFNIPRQLQWIQGPREHRKRHIIRQNPRFLLFSCYPPNKQWNVIKAKVWARLTPIWALVPLSHYIAWIVPFWVNTFLPSNSLARPSLIVQNGRQNGTERKSAKYSLKELLNSHLKTKNL